MANLVSPGVSLVPDNTCTYTPKRSTKKLRKGAFFTDIHFGKKSNSPIHNQDCLDFLAWFCEQVQADPTIDYIGFLGDWNENRSSINIATLNSSHEGASMLNNLGLPVFFVVGNHDLYHRNSREIHSIVTFKEFSNFVVIDEPKIIDQIEGGALFSPYMFHDEYPGLQEYLKIPFWAGHFEFQGFIVTGYNVKMPTGPAASDFKGPKHIVSGHFHKRQEQDNIVYMGNTFPMDFGDAGDFNRGMMTYDHIDDDMTFIDWPDCPKYLKIKLSQLLDDKVTMYRNARVKCLVDVPITFEESTLIRQQMMDAYKLREFALEETQQLNEALTSTEVSEETKEEVANKDEEISTVDDLVIKMLQEIKSDHIDNNLLIEQYKRLTIS